VMVPLRGCTATNPRLRSIPPGYINLVIPGI
jgi:hypothetical protein